MKNFNLNNIPKPLDLAALQSAAIHGVKLGRGTEESLAFQGEVHKRTLQECNIELVQAWSKFFEGSLAITGKDLKYARMAP